MRLHLDRIVRDLEPRIGALQFDRAALGRLLLAASALPLLLAALGYALGGYHVGFAALNALGAGLPEVWLQRLTYLGDALFALILLLLVARRHPELVWLALLAALIATGISHLCKLAITALRPAAVLAPESFRLIGPDYQLASFPSGHATTAFVTAAVFCCLAPRIGLRLLLLACGLLVGWSRIAVGAHWPLDVLAGMAIGCFSVWLAIQLMDDWNARLHPRRFLVVVALLLGTAAWALFLTPPYPQARPQLLLLALAALLLALYDFVLLPLQQRSSS